MKENVYMHAISNYDFNKQTISLLDIVRDGSIKSLRNQGVTESYSFSGLDYISLCDYEKRYMTPKGDDYYNAYNNYVKFGISLAFDKDRLDVVVPEYVDIRGNTRENIELMQAMGNSEKRYSDFLDEVQVKDILTLDTLEYLTFPVKNFFRYYFVFTKEGKYEALRRKIYELNLIMDYFNIHKDIYDIDTQTKLNDDGIKKLIFKK